MTKDQDPKREPSPPTEYSESQELEKIISQQIGDLVSQKQRDVIVARMTSLMVSEHFSGPLPHPKHIRGYEQASPGAADRIIGMAEMQQKHHIDMDQGILEAEVKDRKLGMWLGAGAFTILVVCATITALASDSEIIPGLFLGAAALGAVGLFIRGRNSNK